VWVDVCGGGGGGGRRALITVQEDLESVVQRLAVRMLTPAEHATFSATATAA
jgi:hypothetical protein